MQTCVLKKSSVNAIYPEEKLVISFIFFAEQNLHFGVMEIISCLARLGL